MKRSCMPLFAISIFSLLCSAFAAISYIDLKNSLSKLSAVERTNENSIALDLTQVAIEVDQFFAAVVFFSTIILGIFGLIGSMKKGRLSVLCIIVDSLPMAYVFFGSVSFMMKKNDLYGDYMLVFLFLALYMTGAVIAFKGREKLKKG